jgi:hypothetical protein
VFNRRFIRGDFNNDGVQLNPSRGGDTAGAITDEVE